MRRLISIKVRLGLFCAALTCPLTIQAATITAPYNENFNSYAVGDTPVNNFTESNSTAYTIVNNGTAGDNQYRANITSASGGANGSAAAQVTNVVGTSFSVSSDLTVRANTAVGTTNTLNAGLGLFGDSADFSTSANQYRLLFTTFGSNAGKLTLTEGSSSSGTGLTGTLSSTGTLLPVIGQKLTLTANLSYTGSTLNINGILTDGTNTLTVTGADTSPQAGQFFGYRTAVNAASGSVTETIDYDNFTVAVPEPAGLGLLALIGLTLVRRRRAGKHL